MDEKEKREMNLKRLEIFHQLLHDSVFERYKLLPQISALSATLLIVATFNEKLLPLTNYVRALLIVLLALIPISLIGFLCELERAEEHASENIKSIGDDIETKKQSWNRFTAYLPRFVIVILTMVIILIILSIASDI